MKKRRHNPKSHNVAAKQKRSTRRAKPPAEASSAALAKPSRGAIQRYYNIPLLFDESREARRLTGHLVHDSWSDGPSAARRDVVDGHVRQIRLKAGPFQLEIVAERRESTWEFVARAYRGAEATNEFVLKVGGRRLLPRSGGFFLWTSTAVPRVLRLESFEAKIEFERLSWQ